VIRFTQSEAADSTKGTGKNVIAFFRIRYCWTKGFSAQITAEPVEHSEGSEQSREKRKEAIN
jgi:hypothetical protein